MDKPFLTIEEQIDLLERRGMQTTEETAPILMREGYYSVVNGYKDPFLDRKASEESGDDRYLPGSTFSDMYTLFRFDRSLREITFKYLIRAEAATRTAVAYCFSERHPEPDAYLNQSSFATREEYESRGSNGRPYLNELQTLINTMMKRAAASNTDFISHYRESYGQIPLWVLANDLTFGNIEHFFNIMKPGEQAAVCRHISMSNGLLGNKRLGYFSVERARIGLEVHVKFRNICAHDERLYCARVGGRKQVGFSAMVWHLERFLPQDVFVSFLENFVALCEELEKKSRKVGHILSGLGINEVSKGISAMRSS